MFHHCLICTDFSDGLDRLVKFVPQLAQKGIKKLVFFHSISVWEEGKVARVDENPVEQAQQQLAQALQSNPEGITVKVEVPRGKFVESALEIIQREQIDLIILGVPIRSSIESKIFGSDSTELAKATSVPLMIVRPQLISTYTEEELSLRAQHLWRYLLIPYNDSESAQYLLKQLKALAANRPSNGWTHCFLLWVIEETGRSEELTQYHLNTATEKLEKIKAELESFNLVVEAQVRQGNPLREMLNVSLHYDISAITIATEYRNNLLSWTVPSLANEVLQRSWFPVILFSPKQ